jgi:Short C-terminal domain
MSQPITSENNIVEELAKLAKLHVDGTLSDEEFKTLKAKILNALNAEQHMNRVADQSSDQSRMQPRSTVLRAAIKTPISDWASWCLALTPIISAQV